MRHDRRLEPDGDHHEAEGGGQAVGRRGRRHPDDGARDEAEGSRFETLLVPFGGRKICRRRRHSCHESLPLSSSARGREPTGWCRTRRPTGGRQYCGRRPFAPIYQGRCVSRAAVLRIPHRRRGRSSQEAKARSSKAARVRCLRRSSAFDSTTSCRPATNSVPSHFGVLGVGPPLGSDVQPSRSHPPAASRRAPIQWSRSGTSRPGDLGRLVGPAQHQRVLEDGQPPEALHLLRRHPIALEDQGAPAVGRQAGAVARVGGHEDTAWPARVLRRGRLPGRRGRAARARRPGDRAPRRSRVGWPTSWTRPAKASSASSGRTATSSAADWSPWSRSVKLSSSGEGRRPSSAEELDELVDGRS